MVKLIIKSKEFIRLLFSAFLMDLRHSEYADFIPFNYADVFVAVDVSMFIDAF